MCKYGLVAFSNENSFVLGEIYDKEKIDLNYFSSLFKYISFLSPFYAEIKEKIKIDIEQEYNNLAKKFYLTRFHYNINCKKGIHFFTKITILDISCDIPVFLSTKQPSLFLNSSFVNVLFLESDFIENCDILKQILEHEFCGNTFYLFGKNILKFERFLNFLNNKIICKKNNFENILNSSQNLIIGCKKEIIYEIKYKIKKYRKNRIIRYVFV